MSKLSDEFTSSELDSVDDMSGPSAPVIYEVIVQEGDEELARPNRSLFWSGIAAGLLISLSVFSEAALRAALGELPWRMLIENMGYSVGFVVVILGRMQLFTENTITTVAPLLIAPSVQKLLKTIKLWSVVFLANMIGAFIAAWYFHAFSIGTQEIQSALAELSLHIFDLSLEQKVTRGVLAGVMIATMVWVLPNARNNAIWIIILFTYFIALGDLTHVVAGAVEAFYAMFMGEVSFTTALFGYIFPTLIGNVIGGTLVFTLLVYAQITPEIHRQ